MHGTSRVNFIICALLSVAGNPDDYKLCQKKIIRSKIRLCLKDKKGYSFSVVSSKIESFRVPGRE